MAAKLKSSTNTTLAPTEYGSISGATTIIAAEDHSRPDNSSIFCRQPTDEAGNKGEEKKENKLGGKNGEGMKPRKSLAKRQWSLQAVKGKVTTRCLWSACKAFTIGVILILLGAAMAMMGFYAEEKEHLQIQQNQTRIEEAAQRNSKNWRPPQIVSSSGGNVISHNSTIFSSTPTTLKYDPYKSGLNKLSYVGPIVMGIGGFVIVAACVMTFEARDSAAKIVPARFRKNFSETTKTTEECGMRNASAQTQWQTLDVYGAELLRFHKQKELTRKSITSAFIRFSKNIQSSIDSTAEYYHRAGTRGLRKCPSAPSLIRDHRDDEGNRIEIEAPRILRVSAFPKPPSGRRLSSNAYPRQTLSVDNPAVRECYAATFPMFIGENGDEDMELGASATRVDRSASNAGLALDLHLPQYPVTLLVRDSSVSPGGKAEAENPVAIAGPSYYPPIEYKIISARPKVDKQTSTSDHSTISMPGWSCNIGGSIDAQMSTVARCGSSFRESKKHKAARKVQRSETIDTASTRHHKLRIKHHLRARTDSKEESASSELRTFISSKSDTGKRHQLLRQSKIEGVDYFRDDKSKAHIV